jgi:DNA repair exonuclease SbcCD ATPase subunit
VLELLAAVASAATVVASVASLAYWLGRKFAQIEERFRLIDERFRQIEERLRLIDERFRQIDERFRLVEGRLAQVERRLERVEARLDKLESAFLQFSDALLTTLGARGVLSETEVMVLKGLAKSLLPAASSKYYTEEVRRRLLELLDRDPRDLTLGDTQEIERIAELIEQEGLERKKRDLVRYAWLLRYYAMAVRAVYIYPKLYKQQRGVLSPP